MAANSIAPVLGTGVYDVAVTATSATGDTGTDTSADELWILDGDLFVVRKFRPTPVGFVADFSRAIDEAAVGPGLPAGAAVEIDTSLPGRARIRFQTPSPLAAGDFEFATLSCLVPAGAVYGAAQALETIALSVNGGDLPATGDVAVHCVGFFGDTTGNGAYSGLDAQRAARVAVGLDTGFEAYCLIDPIIVADVTGNGALSGLDAQRIAQQAVGLDPVEIPDLPQPLMLDEAASRSRQTLDNTVPTSPDRGILGVHETAAVVLPDDGDFRYEQLAPIAVAAIARIDLTLPAEAWATWREPTFEIAALPISRTQRRVDLLTIVLHELGHFPSYGHEDEGFMDDALPPGTRRLPSVSPIEWLMEDPLDEFEIFSIEEVLL